MLTPDMGPAGPFFFLESVWMDMTKKWLPFSRQLVHVLRCAVTEWLDAPRRQQGRGAGLLHAVFDGADPGAGDCGGRLLLRRRSGAGPAARPSCAAWSASKAPRPSSWCWPARSDKDSGTHGHHHRHRAAAGRRHHRVRRTQGQPGRNLGGAAAERTPRWWDIVRTRLLSFGLILVLGFLLMVSLVVSAALAVLENYRRRPVEGRRRDAGLAGVRRSASW